MGVGAKKCEPPAEFPSHQELKRKPCSNDFQWVCDYLVCILLLIQRGFLLFTMILIDFT